MKPPLPWLSLSLAALMAMLAATVQGSALALHREAPVIWQLWTAHGVHHGASHLGANLLLLLATGAFLELALGARWLLGLWLLASPVLAGAVWVLEPQMTEFRGASGMAAAQLFACLACFKAARPWPLLLGLAWLVLVTVGPASQVLPEGVRSAWSVHWAGMACGLLGVALSQRAAVRGRIP